MKCNSYSDLFEDFFRTDAVQDESNGSGTSVTTYNDELFNGYLNDAGSDMAILQSNIETFQSYFIPPQQQAQMPFYQQAQMLTIPPTVASVQKPGFIRNRARKNMRQKSVAAAVKASHMMAGLNNQAGSGYPLMQMYQPTIPTVMTNQIPYYQAAAQIPTYQPVQPQQQQQQPQLILAKSPVAQPVAPLLRSAHPSHPNSPARSPNSNSSDYVKFKLQQKIRSRMVSKGQIPPNPTEEELRLCGLQVPSSAPQNNHVSQLPTPKHSPQIPRTFNNNTAAFIAAPLIINNQLQGQQQQNEDFMKYLDLSGYSQKDPLMMADTNTIMQNIKQQQMPQGQLLLISQQQQQQSDFSYPQQDLMQNNNNYDQFFSDFILY